jgi:uncharacterized protein YbbC (DUF1343 family)
VRFYPVTFTPASSVFAGQQCGGVSIIVTDRQAIRSVRVGVEIASALTTLYPGLFKVNDALRLFGSAADLGRISAGDDSAAIASGWASAEARWRLMRAKYLLY